MFFFGFAPKCSRINFKGVMKLTIFSRVIIAQSAIIALVLGVSLYALTKLHLLTSLNTEILSVDSVCMDEEKRLLKSFLAEIRNGEKYALLGDPAFHDALMKGKADFTEALAKVSALIDTKREKALTNDIMHLHSHYHDEVQLAILGEKASAQTKSIISEGIIEKTNELIRIREQQISNKTATARDQAASTAEVMFWVTMAGITGAMILAYIHARSLSNPLARLVKEMRHVGRGEFTRSIDFKGPKEVKELAQAFNRMAEELAHLDHLKSNFTAHVSHELRTPLTAIREGTALLLEEIPGALSEDQREILNVVQGHSDWLYQSISSILDLSKMEAEMMEYEFTACDLGSIIQKSIHAVELITRKREIHVGVAVNDRLPILLVDERRIQQVLNNLLSNAIKFTPEGGEIYVRASVKRMGPGLKDEVEVAISDNGPGIPNEELENIFKRFYQSVHNGARGQNGTGLGLAIARHIVEAHEGRIWAESQVGCGSVFRFTLPVASVAGFTPDSPTSEEFKGVKCSWNVERS
jgi:two-component system sensor histidine kinase GlrK